MTVVETRISVWEALAGRAPGQPLGPADPGLWTAVAERVNPAKARPWPLHQRSCVVQGRGERSGELEEVAGEDVLGLPGAEELHERLRRARVGRAGQRRGLELREHLR